MDRGQAHTLEGVAAGLILLTSLVFALQATTITPLSASTSNEHIGTQLRAVATGALAEGAETGSLKRAVLHWDDSNGRFQGAGEEGYYVRPGQSPTPNEFIETLQAAYADQGVAFNIYLRYEDRPGKIERQRLLYQGSPTDDAVSSSRSVTVYDNDVFTGTETPVQSSKTYFVRPTSDRGPETPLYTVVIVDIVVWRL